MKKLTKLAKEILDKSLILSLGTVDIKGVWVSDVVFVYTNNFTIYWMSKPTSRHSLAIEKNPKVACTITASFEPNNERALQIEGNARRLDGVHTELEKIHYNKRGKPYLNSKSESIPKGFSWYELVPTKIELHYSVKFDYNRQALKPPFTFDH